LSAKRNPNLSEYLAEEAVWFEDDNGGDVVKSVQKNFKTSEVEDQTPVTPMAGPYHARAERGMMNVMRAAFEAGWEAALGDERERVLAFRAWLKDV